MLEQDYYVILRMLGVRLDYSSDNLFMVERESDVEGYIGRENYMALKAKFANRLRDKYMSRKVGDLRLLDPVELKGVDGGQRCYYLEKGDVMGVSDVHYVMSLKSLYTISSDKYEGMIRNRIPSVGEYDNLFRVLLENNRLYGEGYVREGDFVFDVSDVKGENLLKVESIISLYKQYNYYIACTESSDGLYRLIPLQDLVLFERV